MSNSPRRRSSRLPVSFLLSLGLVATLLAPVTAFGADPRPIVPRIDDPVVAPDAPGASDPIDDQILVRYREGTTPGERRAIREAHGLTRVPGTGDARTEVVVAEGRSTATVRRRLGDERDVVAVAANQRRELAVDISGEPGFGQLWGLHNRGQRIDGISALTGLSDIDLDALEALRLGAGSPDVIVAVVDDGVDTSHPDLEDAIWTNPGEAGPLAANGIDDDGNGFKDDVHGWDFCNDDKTVHDAGQDGHGTHVAGTIGASLDGAGVVGVAPGITIMPLKFIDGGHLCGSDDMAVRAIDYAASFGVRIINASWGGAQPSSVLDAAIAESGALFVAAAGNGDVDGHAIDIDKAGGPRFYPASSTLPNILAVAAIDQRGRLASFSNYGRKSVDLGAPGTNILSTYPKAAGCAAPCYAWSEGTSMAAPHVTGVAALVASHEPALLDQPLQLRSRLLSTGRALSSLSTKTTTGRMVNAWRAVDAVPPVIQAPNRFVVPTGASVSSTSTSLRVSWPPATDAMTSVASYGLRKRAGSTWSTVTSATSATSINSSIRFGTTTTFRLTAKDAPGSTSAPKDGPALTATLYSDSASLAHYGSGWTTSSSSTALGGRLHTARRTGAAMTVSFTGRAIAVVAPRSSTRGAFRVYIDGTLITTIDLARATSQPRRAVFSTSWTTREAHTLRIEAVSARRIDVDGFVITR